MTPLTLTLLRRRLSLPRPGPTTRACSLGSHFSTSSTALELSLKQEKDRTVSQDSHLLILNHCVCVVLRTEPMTLRMQEVPYTSRRPSSLYHTVGKSPQFPFHCYHEHATYAHKNTTSEGWLSSEQLTHSPILSLSQDAPHCEFDPCISSVFSM